MTKGWLPLHRRGRCANRVNWVLLKKFQTASALRVNVNIRSVSLKGRGRSCERVPWSVFGVGKVIGTETGVAELGLCAFLSLYIRSMRRRDEVLWPSGIWVTQLSCLEYTTCKYLFSVTSATMTKVVNLGLGLTFQITCREKADVLPRYPVSRFFETITSSFPGVYYIAFWVHSNLTSR